MKPKKLENIQIADIDWHAIFEHSQVPTVILDKNFQVLTCNNAYVLAVGQSLEVILDESFDKIFPGASREQHAWINSSCQQAWSTDKDQPLALFEHYIGHDNAHWSIVSCAIRDESGQIKYVISQPCNITRLNQTLKEISPHVPSLDTFENDAQKRTHYHLLEVQKLLAIERSRFEDMYRQAPGFICILRGPQHIYEFANDAYYDLIGHREIIGCELARVLPEVVEQGFLIKLNTVYSTGAPFIGEQSPLNCNVKLVAMQNKPT